MSLTSTPSKSSPHLNSFSSSYYQTSYLPSSILQGRIGTHETNRKFLRSQEEKQKLQTVAKSSSASRIYRIYSRGGSIKKLPKNLDTQSKIEGQDPQIVYVFTQKPEFVSIMHEKHESEANEKYSLQLKISLLKRKIMEERKLKDKSQLRICKYVNENERSLKNIELIQRQIRSKLSQICLLAQDCNNLDISLEQAQKINMKIQQRIDQYQNMVERLKRHVQDTKHLLERETHQIHQIKHAQSTQFKKLQNLHTKIYQLKGYKDLLNNQLSNKFDSHS